MASTQDVAQVYSLGDIESYPVAASATIYQGSAVGINAGYARALVAGDKFVGFCDGGAYNSGGAAGAISVRVRKRGEIQLNVASLAITDNAGTAVYASDDNTFTKTSTSNSLIGYTSRFISSGVGMVSFDTNATHAAGG